MKKIFLIAGAMIHMVSASVWADMILLKDGRSFEGRILEKNDVEVVIRDELGRISRFYADQIDKVIEGELKTPLTVDTSKLGDITPKKAELIIRFIEANGTRAILDKHIKRTLNSVPDEKRKSFEVLFNINDMVSHLMPVFDRHFNEAELIDLIAFYESPSGQKMVEISDTLVNEIAQATIEYFKSKLMSPQ